MNRYLTPEIWHRYLETVPSCEYEAIKQATETMLIYLRRQQRMLPNIWEQHITTEAVAANEYFTWVLYNKISKDKQQGTILLSA